jgi:hypothetical protein
MSKTLPTKADVVGSAPALKRAVLSATVAATGAKIGQSRCEALSFCRHLLSCSFQLECLGPDRSHEADEPFHVEIDHRRCVQRQQL